MMTEKSSSALPISTIGRGRTRQNRDPGCAESHCVCACAVVNWRCVLGKEDTITSTHLTSNSGFAREPRRDTRLLTCATKTTRKLASLCF